MDELLAQTGYQLRALKCAQILEGRVTAITPQAVYIDVGAKSEGVVAGKDFDEVKNFIGTLSVGDTVTVYVRNAEDDQGNVVLSLRKAAYDAVWGRMARYLSSGESIEARGVDVNRGGLIVDVDGLRGFIPSSQLLPEHVGKERSLINQKLTVKVIEQDRANNRLVLAQKRVLPAAEEKKRLKAWEQIKSGDLVKGEVLAVTSLGAVVGVGKYLRAFLRLSEIAWEKVGDPSDYLSVGDVVEVKVIEKGADPDGLQVSLKQLGADPWQKVKEKYEEGQEITGRVTKKVPYGFFVELEPGVEGLIYLSKMSGDLDLRVGEEVKCLVENVDAGARRIGLSVVREEVPVIYK